MSVAAWIRTVRAMGIGEGGLSRFLVEWYGPRAGAVGDAAGRLRDSAGSSTAAGTPVQLLVALAVPTDDYAFVVFAAESPDSVERVCADAGAPPDRISVAVGWPVQRNHRGPNL